MNEARENALTGRWILYSPERAGRPDDLAGSRGGGGPPAGEAAGVRDPDCPFCPGNEDRLPGITEEIPAPDGPGWRTRVVPNKFPALGPGEEAPPEPRGPHRRRTVFGRQEVIIETPRHDLDPADLAADEMAAVLQTYRRRYLRLSEEDPALRIFLFRNRGPRAGPSLLHPHSQLIATGFTPPAVAEREERALAHHARRERCLACDALRFEREEEVRVVLDTDAFTAYVPFAAEVPFEIWIVPCRHQAEFGEATPRELTALAGALLRVLRALRDGAGSPDYNLVLHTARRRRRGDPALHWYVGLRPRITTPAGFEVGAEVAINPHRPEDDARALRESAGGRADA